MHLAARATVPRGGSPRLRPRPFPRRHAAQSAMTFAPIRPPRIPSGSTGHRDPVTVGRRRVKDARQRAGASRAKLLDASSRRGTLGQAP